MKQQIRTSTKYADELDNLIMQQVLQFKLLILIGLKRYNKKVNRIVSVCVGPTREKKIAGYFKDVYKDDIKNYHPFEMVVNITLFKIF